MPTTIYGQKACDACAKSKRKCGKELPMCDRCRVRRVKCTYPPVRPTNWVLYQPEGEPDSGVLLGSSDQSSSSSSSPVANSLAPSQIHSEDTIENALQLEAQPVKDLGQDTYPRLIELCSDNLRSSGLVEDGARTLQTDSVSLSLLKSAWFLTPDTWLVDPSEVNSQTRISHKVLMRFVRRLQALVSDWVLKGSSPLFHARLYKGRFPRLTQDSYTALAAYLTKTAHTEDMVVCIIADRFQQLEQEECEASSSSKKLDTFEHMARVHALLVLVVIGLFDGNIRLRHLAEQQIPLLMRWNVAMLESARVAADNGQLLLQNLLDDNLCLLRPDQQVLMNDQSEALWQAWILAESVRRTWLVVCGVESSYDVLQKGKVHCHGGLMFTTRNGVWEARSAWAWTKLCAERDVGFMRRGQTQRLFGEQTPDEVDEFGKIMLEVTFGTERVERWGMEVEY